MLFLLTSPNHLSAWDMTLVNLVYKSGVRDLPHCWLISYLKDREQCIQISVTLETIKMPNGVLHGSILGPLLFLVYVSRLNTFIQHGKLIKYADDTTLY